jgi:hypothetical protein
MINALDIDVTFDRIRAYIDNQDSAPLSVKDKELLDRWDFAYDNLKISSRSAVVSRLMKKYDIAQMTAYKDVLSAERLFGAINRRSPEWLRDFIVEDAVKHLRYATETNNDKARIEARNTLLKVYALDKNDVEGIDPKLLGNNNYFIAVNFGDRVEKINYDKLMEMPTEKKMKMTDFLFQDIDDVECEKIMQS